MEFAERISAIRVVPVVEIPGVEFAVPLAEALVNAGLPCAEITFRTDSAAASIKAIADNVPDIHLGAGTVLTVEQADAAIDAGAKFLVAPGFNAQVVAHAAERGIPMLPGVATPTDIEQALSHGISLVKFFPAEANGGVDYLKAVSAPYRNVRFVPTGGIGTKNLLSYLNLPQVVACGGSWMVKKDLIAAKDFDSVGRLAAEAVALAAESEV
jgi:2-dehydro-3-deoxyphosphogluconate aldolase / (4S)-4-hydroxy-2-oxoglutarate aldolase